MDNTRHDIKTLGTWRGFFKLFFRIPIPWHLYLPIFAANIVITNFSVDLPVRLSMILDSFTMNMYEANFDSSMILQYIGIAIAVTVSQNITTFAYIFADNITIRNARNATWKVLLDIQPDVYKTEEPLSLISRVTNDPKFLATIIKETLMLLTTTYTLVKTFMKMHEISGQLATAIMLTIPYMVIVGLVSGHFLEKAQSRMQLALSHVTAFFAERYNKLKLIKVFTKEQLEDEKTEQFTKSQFRAKISRWIVELIANPFKLSCQALLLGVTLVYGAKLISEGLMPAAMLFAFYQYIAGMNNHFTRYVNYYQTLKMVKGSTGKVSNLFHQPAEQMHREKTVSDVLVGGKNIEFNGVFFAYDKNVVLRDINVRIPLGKMTAIVGPSGAGKTTMFNVLERLYSVKSGHLAVDGTDLEKIHLDEWRRSIGLVSQRPVLFSGTLRENLLYGVKTEVSDEALERALKLAQLDDFIASLPHGLETQVGEFGSQLSGGQRQRVAIARIFLMNPPIVLLDEATSALDASTQRKVQKALELLMEGRTSLVIAHRLQTVRDAEQILLMKDGAVEASGTHETLYEKSPLYRQLIDVEMEKNEALKD